MKKLRFLFLGILLAGCTLLNGTPTAPTPKPTLPDPLVTTISAPDVEKIVSDYLKAWNDREFGVMYEMLSSKSKERISRVTFLERYEDLWSGGHLTGIDFEIVSSLISPGDAQVRYRITLNSSIVEEVTRDTWIGLEGEAGVWGLDWSDSSILPELTSNDGLLLAPVIPNRANIYDRNGLAIATLADVFALWIRPNDIGDEDAEGVMLGALSRLLDRPQESILELYDDIRDTDWYVDLGVVSREEFLPFESTFNAVGGVDWRGYPARYYYFGGIAPHAAGYVNWIPAEELDTYLFNGYMQDEFVGQRGIEKVFEPQLRGSLGGTLYIIDSAGQLGDVLANTASEPSIAVYSTMDRDFQKHVQDAIAGFTGAIVVLERDTGAVLAMASTPDFDPNLFDPTHPNNGVGTSEIFNNPQRPLFNRATHGEYPLGSVFKTISMAAALESELFTPETIRNCPLVWEEFPGTPLYDWRYERELPAQGNLSLTQALERSCNTYFYQIGYELFNEGFETALSEMARGFGLGDSTGIEIGDEAGLIPDPETKEDIFEEEWGPQDSVNLAIGQSFLEVTPLQVARFIAALGNGGTIYQPQIVDRIQSAEGEVEFQFEPIVQGQLPISAETLTAIQEAMLLVTSSPDGTARRILRYPYTFRIQTAGKTGTATSGEFTEPHSWFAGYSVEGREDKPDIAVVVLVEEIGEGSTWAAPIFRRVMESYFFGGPQSLYSWEARIGVPATPTPTPGPEDGELTPTPEG
jgi:penicillin-binding protein 2